MSSTDNRRDFADRVMARIAQPRNDVPMRYDERSFTLRVDGDDEAFWLGTLFQVYSTCHAARRDAIIKTTSDVWFILQQPIPAKLAGQILRPYRDESHPLSYRLIPVDANGRLMLMTPFSDAGSLEVFDLPDAYHVWWSEQIQRGYKPKYRNLFHWINSGLVSVDEMRVLVLLARLRESCVGRNLQPPPWMEEIKWLGAEESPSRTIRHVLDDAVRRYGSAIATASHLTQLTESQRQP